MDRVKSPVLFPSRLRGEIDWFFCTFRPFSANSLRMQKALSELLTLPEAELVRLFEHDPVLVTQDGEPKFVAQSLDSFEAMVRRLRQLEANSERQSRPGKLVLLRS